MTAVDPLISQQKHYCPVCQLESPFPVEENELEITYKVKGKIPKFIKGWWACPRCLVGADKCVQQFMRDRLDRGKSLAINRDQFKKLEKSGCGCGA